MSLFDASFELIINIGHSDLYFTVQLFCLIILVLLAKRDSGMLRCPVTTLILKSDN